MRIALRTRLRAMTPDDITQVAEIEEESFPSIWPPTAYRRELQNKIARYVVLTEVRDEPGAPDDAGFWGTLRRIVGGAPAGDERLLGFIGVWLMVGDAHIVTVAVREAYRRKGIGERLLIAALELSMQEAQETMTLEVRASNEGAQRLYTRWGFARVGVRKNYYTDDHEDAVLMTAGDLQGEAYQRLFRELRESHRARHAELW